MLLKDNFRKLGSSNLEAAWLQQQKTQWVPLLSAKNTKLRP